MNRLKTVSAQTAIAALVLGAVLSTPPASAQVEQAIETAQQACAEQAEADGFTLQEVVEAGPSDRPDKDAKIVLNLTRDGAEARLTCYYSEAEGVVFGDEAEAGAGSGVDLSRLWWMLLPLIGLPLLLWWAGQRDRATHAAAGQRAFVADPSTRTEAVVRNNGNSINIHSGPGGDYRVTDTLSDQQRVALTGNYQNEWAELADGGWVHTHNLDISRYASR
ncbi:MAG: SH3 domain-containing protein [Leptolyngbyaceae cyanobacterium SL_7_1]|nr:SH3 domain-containing protein [Leptolyngbyaceae cyanobacterium SL_7_1]